MTVSTPEEEAGDEIDKARADRIDTCPPVEIPAAPPPPEVLTPKHIDPGREPLVRDYCGLDSAPARANRTAG